MEGRIKAWLVTWEWVGDHAAVADKVAAVFNPLWGAERVAGLVELLYVRASSSLAGMAEEYAKAGVHRAYQPEISKDVISCGHNPHLEARKVKDLTVVQDPDTQLETITWTEYARFDYEIDGSRVSPKEVAAEQRHTVTRRIVGPLSDEHIWDRKHGSFKPGWGPRERSDEQLGS